VKTLTVVLHLEIEDAQGDPAEWAWHALLDLGSNEVVTVDEVFDDAGLVASKNTTALVDARVQGYRVGRASVYEELATQMTGEAERAAAIARIVK